MITVLVLVYKKALVTLYKCIVMQINLVVVVGGGVIVDLYILTARPQHQRWNRCRILASQVRQNG